MPFFPTLDVISWLALLSAGLIIGLSKAGIKGIVMFSVVILVPVFGGKVSMGLLLPMFLVGDVLAVKYYNRHAIWKYVWRLIPAAAVGVVAATLVGDWINEVQFTRAIAIVILVSLFLLLYLEKYPVRQERVEHPFFAFFMGFLGGFSSMIGNSGGPVLNLFLLSVGLPKNNFIGTAAYFFLLINLIKLPFHFFVWETVNWQSLWLNAFAVPVILLGFFLGVRLVKLIPEKAFRWFIIGVTGLVAVRLLVG